MWLLYTAPCLFLVSLRLFVSFSLFFFAVSLLQLISSVLLSPVPKCLIQFPSLCVDSLKSACSLPFDCLNLSVWLHPVFFPGSLKLSSLAVLYWRDRDKYISKRKVFIYFSPCVASASWYRCAVVFV